MDDGRLIALGFRWHLPHARALVEALHPQAQAVEKLGLNVTEDVPSGSFLGTNPDRDIRGQCLPDTVDPRGPKGN